MSDCIRCDSHCSHRLCVQKVPIFSHLHTETLVRLSEKIGHLEFHKGALLFEEGSRPASLFILNEGSVKAFKYTPDGREQILYVFTEGDFFGEQFLLGNRKAAYSVAALAPVKICTLSKDNLNEELRLNPDIAIRIIEELEERLAGLEDVVQGLGVRSVDARIGSLLLSFCDKYGVNTPEGISIRLPLSREGMANYLGIARETVSRKLGQLEHDGILCSVGTRSILIKDRATLEQLSGRFE